MLISGCVSKAQLSESNIKTSGRFTADAFYGGEPVEIDKIQSELQSYLPMINEALRSKGLLSTTSSSAMLLVLRATTLQLSTKLRISNNEASFEISLSRLKNKDQNIRIGLPIDRTTIIFSQSNIKGTSDVIDRQAIITQLVNTTLNNFSEQLDKSKSR